MKITTGKYGENANESQLKKLGLERSANLSSGERKELESHRNAAAKKKELAKKVTSEKAKGGRWDDSSRDPKMAKKMKRQNVQGAHLIGRLRD